MIGDCAVVLAAAQAGTSALNAMTRLPQSVQRQVEHAAVLMGSIGMSFAARITTFGLIARSTAITCEWAARIVVSSTSFQRSFVAKWKRTMSAGLAPRPVWIDC